MRVAIAFSSENPFDTFKSEAKLLKKQLFGHIYGRPRYGSLTLIELDLWILHIQLEHKIKTNPYLFDLEYV